MQGHGCSHVGKPSDLAVIWERKVRRRADATTLNDRPTTDFQVEATNRVDSLWAGRAVIDGDSCRIHRHSAIGNGAQTICRAFGSNDGETM